MQLSPLLLERIEAAEKRGEQLGRQKLIFRQLNRRVGIIAPELQLKIEALSLNLLDDLSEALLDFKSLADLENWLNQNQV